MDVPTEHTVDVRVAFVGRPQEQLQIERALEAGESLTLVGTGGVGKSRLAIEAVERWERRTGARAAFVALASVPPEAVADAVARSLGISEEPQREVLETVADALAAAPRALLLDNCEHAAPEIAAVVRRLRAIEGVAIVATSRSRLGLADETVLEVSPFDARDGSAFFAARARSAAISVDVDGSDASAVERIVANLDGLAIAIDLAAARLASLDVASLAEELAQLRPYQFRSSGKREQRHWSLNHVVDWSVERLDEDGRRAFALAGRFAGNFHARDLAALAGDDSNALDEHAAVLATLFDQSLIARAADGDSYTMLAPIRAVSAKRLSRFPDRRAIEARFAHHMNDLAATIERLESPPGSAAKLGQIAARYQDLTSALEWALAAPRERLAGVVDVFHALVATWCDGGRFTDGLRWCDRVLPCANVLDLQQRSRVLYGAIIVAHAAGDYARMLALGPQLVTTFTISNDSLGLARAYNALGIASLSSQRIDGAETYCRTSFALYEALGHARGMSAALINLGNIALQGRLDAASAQKHFLAAAEMLGPDGSDALLAIAYGNLADAALDLNDPAEAERQARLGLERLSGTGNAAHAAWQRTTIARAKLSRSDQSSAARELALAFALLREQPQAEYLAGAVQAVVRLLAARGEASEAAVLALLLERFRQERAVRARGASLVESVETIERLKRELGEAGFEAAAAGARGIETRDLSAIAELKVAKLGATG